MEQQRVKAPQELLRYVGVRFGCPWKCWDFVRHGYALCGISLPESSLEARRLFVEISREERARAWDIAYFVCPPPQSFSLTPIGERRHVGIMIDHRWMVHCSAATFGVARTDIDKYRFALRCFLRLRPLSAER